MAEQPGSWMVEPVISVKICSARFSDDNDILDCGIIEGPDAALAGKV